MARRNLDLGPRSSDPVGRIRRRASSSRMSIKHVKKKATVEDEHLRIVDQPFRVVITKQNHNNAVRWEVAIERGSKLDEGYSYRLPIRHRRKLTQALGIASTLAMGLACSRFYIEFDEDVHHALAMPAELELFFDVNAGDDGITCYLNAVLLQRQYSDEDIQGIFTLLMERTDRREVI